MSQFYVSIIFIGMLLIVISFVWILFDKKQSYDYSKRIDEKKTELLNIIEDAEQMLEELNKFSDFIVGQMDSKSEEINNGLKKADERLKQLDSALKDNIAPKAYKAAKVPGRVNLDFIGISGTQFEGYGRKEDGEKPKAESQAADYTNDNAQQDKAKEKIIPLNAKRSEVIKLSENGLNETEIAKKLSIGKGEIELILGMNK